MPEIGSEVTVGAICLSCGLYSAFECPYNNHQKTSTLDFKGDIRGKCIYYHPIFTAGEDNNMQKTASQLKDSELNIELYRKMRKLSSKEIEKFIMYWDHMYPDSYSRQMIDNVNNSKQKKSEVGKKERKNQFVDNFKTKKKEI